MAIEISPAVRFLAVFFAGLALVPAGAHLLELSNKLKLPPDNYMTVQSIYAGWAFLGLVVWLALFFTLWLAILERGNGTPFRFALAAFLCIVGTQAIFWAFTYPMNVLTENWTKMPPDLEAARRQWEYSHAASAALNFIAFACAVLAIVTGRSAN
jgi:hypothetical protein